MKTNKTYTVVGTSVRYGQRKMRFANDLASRVKRLEATDNEEITLIEFAHAVTKPDAVFAAAMHPDFADEANQAVIQKWLRSNAPELAADVNENDDVDQEEALISMGAVETAPVEDPSVIDYAGSEPVQVVALSASVVDMMNMDDTVDEDIDAAMSSEVDLSELTDEQLAAMEPAALDEEGKRLRRNAMKRIARAAKREAALA